MNNRSWVFFLVFLTFLVGAGLYAFKLEIEDGTTPGAQQLTNFEVIAYYNNCDVVRYAPPGASRYAYLLDCTTK